MTAVEPTRTEATAVPSLPAAQAGALDADDVLARLGSRTGGLSADEAARRVSIAGANAVRSYRVRALPVLVRQLRSPLLLLCDRLYLRPAARWNVRCSSGSS